MKVSDFLKLYALDPTTLAVGARLNPATRLGTLFSAGGIRPSLVLERAAHAWNNAGAVQFRLHNDASTDLAIAADDFEVTVQRIGTKTVANAHYVDKVEFFPTYDYRAVGLAEHEKAR